MNFIKKIAAKIRPVLKFVPTVLLVVDTIIRIGAVVTVPRNTRPTTAMAWLMAIFVAPIPGSVLFRFFGSPKLPEDRREKQRMVNAYIQDSSEEFGATESAAIEPRWFDSVVELNRNLGGMPLVADNSVTLLPDYVESIAEMTKAVAEAKHFVHVEFYIFTRDKTTMPFFDALAAARERGVDVRVLFDHWATMRNPEGRATRDWLTSTGIPFEQMLPFNPLKRRPDLRNHRKIVVIDAVLAFTGSQNMVDASYNKRGNIRRGLHWKDLMLRIEGPAAMGLDALFLTDWYSETDETPPPDDTVLREFAPRPDGLECQVVPSGPGFDGENNLRLFNALVYGAQERLIITSPYFVPDDSMMYAITTAAERGVEVQLFACAVADQFVVFHAQRSYYETLLRAGVRIFLYEEPTVLHSKHFTVDDDVAVVGSSNMDMRSFTLNLEVSLMVRGTDFVRRLREVEDDYRAKSREVTLDTWLARPAIAQVVDTVARLTASLQ